uniref:C-type lectin domain-containing protein n=1 Tax=Catharus ustulatus TaxID=91951 RepID=A0A8C3TQH8_CATUS
PEGPRSIPPLSLPPPRGPDGHPGALRRILCPPRGNAAPGGSLKPLPVKGGRRFPPVLQPCLSAPAFALVPAERDGCRLCAVGWRLIGNKCYWISDGMNPWSKSREDCGNRGSMLLVPWDQDELVKEMMALGIPPRCKPTRHFWIGLSVPVAGTGWMWENGSDLDQEHGIVSQDCNTRLQWICKRESAEI